MPLYAAVVFSRDEVQLLTAGDTREAVTARVATYVHQHADHLLWPGDARRVHLLLGEGRSGEAIDLYFARVGERWAREYLKIEQVETPGTGDGVPGPRPVRG